MVYEMDVVDSSAVDQPNAISASFTLVDAVNKKFTRWSPDLALHLTYALNIAPGSPHYQTVRQGMWDACAGWASVCNVKFEEVPLPLPMTAGTVVKDYTATEPSRPVFIVQVQPDIPEGAIAMAFFPRSLPSDRILRIFDSCLIQTAYPLAGVLRHELGHVLGFRHEHAQMGGEGEVARIQNEFDYQSVMGYPHLQPFLQANRGVNPNPMLKFSWLDVQFAAILYGDNVDAFLAQRGLGKELISA